MKCRSLKPNLNKVCIADLNSKIKIQTTSEVYSNNPDTVPTAQFVDIVEMWALINTGESFQYKDGVQIDNRINTDFYIMYTTQIDFTQTLWVEYDNNKYKVINVNNIDEQGNFVRLRTVKTGDKNIIANLR